MAHIAARIAINESGWHVITEASGEDAMEATEEFMRMVAGGKQAVIRRSPEHVEDDNGEAVVRTRFSFISEPGEWLIAKKLDDGEVTGFGAV